ncbi:IncA family protein [Chlamydia pneumoniae LPCoLN]|uniref:IncA family protein n=1 Tax=Chlamydia pneumoniae TaxID=83558 RepID=UPI0001BD9CFA|nr:IncA family protein [Chlamydia pneumoniae]ACZ33189.1 IncA family protein [Chlamydia pneumoniae LPCoLN]ETR80091.1 hypothetical protein X556_0581 [Chlamydia pneumoniae B21]
MSSAIARDCFPSPSPQPSSTLGVHPPKYKSLILSVSLIVLGALLLCVGMLLLVNAIFSFSVLTVGLGGAGVFLGSLLLILGLIFFVSYHRKLSEATRSLEQKITLEYQPWADLRKELNEVQEWSNFLLDEWEDFKEVVAQHKSQFATFEGDLLLFGREVEKYETIWKELDGRDVALLTELKNIWGPLEFLGKKGDRLQCEIDKLRKEVMKVGKSGLKLACELTKFKSALKDVKIEQECYRDKRKVEKLEVLPEGYRRELLEVLKTRLSVEKEIQLFEEVVSAFEEKLASLHRTVFSEEELQEALDKAKAELLDIQVRKSVVEDLSCEPTLIQYHLLRLYEVQCRIVEQFLTQTFSSEQEKVLEEYEALKARIRKTLRVKLDQVRANVAFVASTTDLSSASESLDGNDSVFEDAHDDFLD